MIIQPIVEVSPAFVYEGLKSEIGLKSDLEIKTVRLRYGEALPFVNGKIQVPPTTSFTELSLLFEGD